MVQRLQSDRTLKKKSSKDFRIKKKDFRICFVKSYNKNKNNHLKEILKSTLWKENIGVVS